MSIKVTLSSQFFWNLSVYLFGWLYVLRIIYTYFFLLGSIIVPTLIVWQHSLNIEPNICLGLKYKEIYIPVSVLMISFFSTHFHWFNWANLIYLFVWRNGFALDLEFRVIDLFPFNIILSYILLQKISQLSLYFKRWNYGICFGNKWMCQTTLTLLPLSYCQLNLIKISCFIVLPLFESGSVSEQLILIKLLSTQHMDS